MSRSQPPIREGDSGSSSPKVVGGSGGLVKELEVEGRTYSYYDVTLLGEDYERLPYSLRILLECMVRRGHRDTAGGGADAWKESVR